MFFVSKKKYDELLKQKENFERIAEKAVTQNGRLLEDWNDVIKEMKSIQELNHQLAERNDKLHSRVKELEAKLDFTIKQRDYYYDLLKNTKDAYEEGKYITREAE